MPALQRLATRFWQDPRHLQILSQLVLLAAGLTFLGFDLRPVVVLATIASALVFQLAFALWFRATLDPRSVMASSLSLCLLLRTGEPLWGVLAALLVVASKFLIRVRGKHIFNPSDFALVVLLLAFPEHVWVSAGQWGSATLIAFLLAAVGSLILYRARRSDIVIAFLLAYTTMVTVRSLWLNEPLTIAFHRLESGSLILFSFFMISDPKATPDSRTGRILFAILVAAGAYSIQYQMYRTNGLLYSLAALSVMIPLIDRVLPGPRYEWGAASPLKSGFASPLNPPSLVHFARRIVPRTRHPLAANETSPQGSP